MANLGVHVLEQATAVGIPVVADSGIPYVAGIAPVHTAEKPGKAQVPILCTSWGEAVKKLGFSYDWEKYPLCEFMYSHFRLFGCQPVIFCNALDPAVMRENVEAKEYPVANHKITLPLETAAETLVITSGSETLTSGEDYVAYYTSDGCAVELLEDGKAYNAAALSAAYAVVKPEAVQEADIVESVAHVDDCMTAAGKIPDLLCAPGWSHKPTVAAVMAAKAAGIMGLFRAKALIDADCGPDGVQEYSQLADYKNRNNFVDENQILCWPMVKLGDLKFHLSTQLAGLMAQVDTGNGGCPYESPSNKKLQMDGCCLADGTEVNLSWPQVNLVAGDFGAVSALNFLSLGWTAKGNYTACYPGNTDVKDQFIPVSRMFDWVGNTILRTFWSRLDKPMTRLLLDSILDTSNIWLNGLVGTGRLLGGRAEIRESENPLTDLMAGILRIHIYLAPPSPAQQIDFTLEYESEYVTAALAA